MNITKNLHWCSMYICDMYREHSVVTDSVNWAPRCT